MSTDDGITWCSQHLNVWTPQEARMGQSRQPDLVADYLAELSKMQYGAAQGGCKVGNEGKCNPVTIDRLTVLLDEDSTLYAREQAYLRHGLPVPDAITKRRDELHGAIECAWREHLDKLIAVETARIEELRSREEKREQSERELERLKALKGAK